MNIINDTVGQSILCGSNENTRQQKWAPSHQKERKTSYSNLHSAPSFLEMQATISFSCNFYKRLKVQILENIFVGILNELQELLLYQTWIELFSEACPAELPCLVCPCLWPYKTPKGGGHLSSTDICAQLVLPLESAERRISTVLLLSSWCRRQNDIIWTASPEVYIYAI